MDDVKANIMSFFKIKTTKDYSKPTRVENVHECGKKPTKLKLQKQFEDNIIKNIRNIFRLKKENTAVKDRIIRDIKNLLEQQEEKYYKPVRVDNFHSSNYIEYKSNGHKNKTLLTKKIVDEIKPNLKDINNLKKPDSWKTQLTIVINFISSKETDEEGVMHSKSDNIMIYDKADEVIEELFELFLKRYQIGLKISTKSGDFIFDCVQLLYYKCHKKNLNRGGSYIDSPDWKKNKKQQYFLSKMMTIMEKLENICKKR